MNSNDLPSLFFSELKKYNSPNFKTLLRADLTKEDPVIHKSCSSVVTRYFIFCEKHPEVPQDSLRMLYFKLRIDMIARYFSEYPAANLDDLKPFQEELRRFVQHQKEESEKENHINQEDLVAV